MTETWSDLYQLALVELDTSQLQQRILETRAAILTRLKSLPENAIEEKQAIADAMHSLRLLERESAK